MLPVLSLFGLTALWIRFHYHTLPHPPLLRLESTSQLTRWRESWRDFTWARLLHQTHQVLRACADQLCGVFQHLFHMSLHLKRIPVLWNTCLCYLPSYSPSTHQTSSTILNPVISRNSQMTLPLWDVWRVARRRSTGAWWTTLLSGVGKTTCSWTWSRKRRFQEKDPTNTEAIYFYFLINLNVCIRMLPMFYLSVLVSTVFYAMVWCCGAGARVSQQTDWLNS